MNSQHFTCPRHHVRAADHSSQGRLRDGKAVLGTNSPSPTFHKQRQRDTGKHCLVGTNSTREEELKNFLFPYMKNLHLKSSCHFSEAKTVTSGLFKGTDGHRGYHTSPFPIPLSAADSYLCFPSTLWQSLCPEVQEVSGTRNWTCWELVQHHQIHA